MDSSAFRGLGESIIVVGIAIGLALGAVVFEFIPWLFHHVSIHWIAK